MNVTKSKLGQMGKIGTIILVIAGAVIIYMFIAKFTQRSSFEGAINVCRFSVIGQSSTEIISSSPFDVDCTKRYITFYNTKVDLGLSQGNMQPMVIPNAGNIKKFSKLTDSIVNGVIAEEMRICWFQFAEGKIKVFANNDKTRGSQDNVCFVCSEINFEKSVQKDNFTGLIDYLKNTKVVEQNQYYYDYIDGATKSRHSWEEFNANSKNPIGMYQNLEYINKTQQYLVVFMKENHLFGQNEYYVEVMAADKINKVCELQPS